MNELSDLQENVLLSGHTTFRIGGPARYFVIAKNNDELAAAIKWARENSQPFFILGGGSNLLVGDKGFNGLVIKMKDEKLEIEEDGEQLKINCGASVSFGKVIMEAVKKGYSGAEWGFGIPGTVGGAICGNAGRLKQEIAQIVAGVTILDKDLNIKNISNEDCLFGYRESRFKKTGEIILSASLVFQKKDQAAIDQTLGQAKEIIKQAPPFPSAGCIFKNYKIKPDDALLSGHPELKELVREGKLGVGQLIDQCGLKGKQMGGAKIWEGHANYMVNVGGAKASDVLELIKSAKEAVKNKFGLELEEEVRRVGEF